MPPKLYPNNCWCDSKQKLKTKTSPSLFEHIITIPLGGKIPRHLFFGVPGVASSGGMERFFKASKVGVGIPQWSPLIRTTPSSSEKPMAKVEGLRSFQWCKYLQVPMLNQQEVVGRNTENMKCCLYKPPLQCQERFLDADG